MRDFQSYLERVELKRQMLDQVGPTIDPQANVQTATAKSFSVDSIRGVAYPALGNTPVLLLTYQVPTAMSGAINAMVIQHVGAAGSFADNSGNVVWHVFKNGAPVRGLGNVYAQIGSTQQPVDSYLLLQQNDLIQIFVECPGAPPAGTPFARLIGFIDYGGIGTYVPQDGIGRGAQNGRLS